MPDARHPMIELMASWFLGWSPLVFLCVTIALSVLTIWTGRSAWISLRILVATASAPVAQLGSPSSGLVKLRGTAQPPPAPPGYVESSTVWRETMSRGGGSLGTTSRTVGHVRIQTPAGICRVDLAKAKVVPTVSSTESEFLDRSRWKSFGEIRSGDPIFALGALHSSDSNAGGVPEALGELRPVGGVLLISGAPEREVKVQFGIWLLLQGPAAILLATLLVWGSWIHMTSYPPGGIGSIRTFVETLAERPFEGYPGVTHPDWPAPPEEEWPAPAGT